MHNRKIHRCTLFFALLITAVFLLPVFGSAEETSSQLSGAAWIDKNINGFNDQEKPLEGVHITLEMKDPSGTFQPVADTCTGKDGYYLFGSLADGEYRLHAELPDRYVFTYHGDDSSFLPAAGTVSETPVFTLENNQQLSLNIGATKADSYVRATAFEDLNANGGKMSSEPLVRHVSVSLQYVYDGVTYTLATDSSNKSGEVQFDHLSPGTYHLSVTLPDGYIFGPLGEKVNAFYNCVPPTEDQYGETAPFVVPAKGSTGLAIGVVKTGTVEGSLWFDKNASGQLDQGEGGIEGIELTLYSPDFNLTRTASTDADGCYVFKNLQEGNYELSLQLPSQMMFTYGNSLFTSAESKESTALSVTTEDKTSVSPIGVMPNTSVSFIAFIDQNLNGNMDADEAALPGASFTVSQNGNTVGTVVSDEQGKASLTNVRGGSVSLNCTLPENYIFSLPGGQSVFSAAVGLTSLSVDQTAAHGQDTLFYAAATLPVSVNGMLFEDADALGIYQDGAKLLENFTVQLTDADKKVLFETVTNADGAYQFSSLLPGTYGIRVLLKDPYAASAYTADTNQPHPNSILSQTMEYGETDLFTLNAGESRTLDAALFQAGSVRGQVLLNPAYDNLSTNAGGLEGMTVTLLNSSNAPVSQFSVDHTDADGVFYIKGILPGTYSVLYEANEGMALLIPSAGAKQYQSEPFTIQNGNCHEFAPVPAVKTGSVSGSVLHRQNTETSVPIETTAALNSKSDETKYETVTDANGAFLLNEILPGDYTLTLTLPEGYMVNYTENSLFSTSMTNTVTCDITVDMGAQITNANVLASLPASLSGRLYWDENASMDYDEGETVLGQFSFSLVSDTLGTYPLTTLEDGTFASPSVLPGQYRLSCTLEDDCILSDSAAVKGDAWTVPVTLSDGGQNTAFSLGVLRFASVSGNVWSVDGSDNGISGLTVILRKDGAQVAEIVTDAQGAFTFDHLYPGQYTLHTTLPSGFSFARKIDTSVRNSYILDNSSSFIDAAMGNKLTGCDIGIGALGGIGDTAWLDLNRNGMLDLDEVGMPGITIELYQYGQWAASVTTDVYGHYEFSNLFPGSYEMHVIMPEELKATVHQEEFPLVASIMPESDETTVIIENVIVPSGSMNLNCDLGFVLRKDGVYPAEVNSIPQMNWKPYSQR